ncbi:MAG: PEP-CTERM sorting domain-containing protein [Proteobacteria bacterium]|nr:PEP-CTERM sorting domain-containing protein [Pseudomonadota bacterium]
MDLQTPGSSPIFQETGASGLNLNPGGLSTGINFGTYAWDSYASSISLGTLLAGQSVIIDYVIGSSADGTTTPGFSPGCGYGYGYGGECYGGPIFTAFNNVCAGESLIFDGCGSGFYALGSAIGRFGDPLNFGDTASIALVPVPEPASMGVLGAGVAGLAFMRRRRSKA